MVQGVQNFVLKSHSNLEEEARSNILTGMLEDPNENMFFFCVGYCSVIISYQCKASIRIIMYQDYIQINKTHREYIYRDGSKRQRLGGGKGIYDQLASIFVIYDQLALFFRDIWPTRVILRIIELVNIKPFF